MTLIEAGESIQPDGWRQSIDGFKTFTRTGSSLAYAFVRAGVGPPLARLGRSLLFQPARAVPDPAAIRSWTRTSARWIMRAGLGSRKPVATGVSVRLGQAP